MSDIIVERPPGPRLSWRAAAGRPGDYNGVMATRSTMTKPQGEIHAKTRSWQHDRRVAPGGRQQSRCGSTPAKAAGVHRLRHAARSGPSQREGTFVSEDSLARLRLARHHRRAKE